MANRKSLVSSIASLFEDPKFSDFKVDCRGRTWNVYKSIVCSQSDVFEKACTGQFKESRDGAIHLADDEPSVVHEMLRYMYTSDYQDEHTGEQSSYGPLLFNVHVNTIADKYNMPDLADLATAKFSAGAAAQWNLEDFADAIEEMYTTAPHSKKGMQTQAIGVAVDHAKELYEQDLGSNFREMAGKTPEFASGFAARMISGGVRIKPQDTLQRTIACDGCSLLTSFNFGRPVPGKATQGVSMNTSCSRCGYSIEFSHFFSKD